MPDAHDKVRPGKLLSKGIQIGSLGVVRTLAPLERFLLRVVVGTSAILFCPVDVAVIDNLVGGRADVLRGWHGGDGRQRPHHRGRSAFWESDDDKVEDWAGTVGVFEKFPPLVEPAIEHFLINASLSPFFQPLVVEDEGRLLFVGIGGFWFSCSCSCRGVCVLW
jgi:hypothetical protein